jgi:hypothetical protein
MLVLVSVFLTGKSLSTTTSYKEISAHIAELNQTKVACILTVTLFCLMNGLGASSIQIQAMVINFNFSVAISMLKESFLAMIYSVL